jgi:hypothetical protein
MSEIEQNERKDNGPGKFDINAVIADARMVITAPGKYFTSMPKTGGFVEPLIFIAVMAVIAGALSAVLSFFGSPVGMRAFGLAAIILVPIGSVIGAFIISGILFVIWKLMGSELDYEASFRCLAAIMAIYPIIAVLSIIPYVGSIASVAWSTYLLIEASVAVHGRERKTSQLVFGIIGALLIFWNVSAEHTTRQLSDQAAELGRLLEQYDK